MQIGLTSISLFYGKIRLKLIQKHGVAINVMATVARVTALKKPLEIPGNLHTCETCSDRSTHIWLKLKGSGGMKLLHCLLTGSRVISKKQQTFTLILFIVLSVFAVTSVIAAEGGYSNYVPGTYGDFAAAVRTPNEVNDSK